MIDLRTSTYNNVKMQDRRIPTQQSKVGLFEKSNPMILNSSSSNLLMTTSDHLMNPSSSRPTWFNHEKYSFDHSNSRGLQNAQLRCSLARAHNQHKFSRRHFSNSLTGSMQYELNYPSRKERLRRHLERPAHFLQPRNYL